MVPGEVGQRMKVLNPSVTFIVPSHMKPEYLPSSLDAMIHQTRRDIQIVVIDSGEWIDQQDGRSMQMQAIYHEYSAHPLVEWYCLGEPPALIERKCPISYIINEAIRAGLARGKYICIGTDDDLHHPDYVEKMAGFLDEHPWNLAVFCGQERVRVHAGGQVEPLPWTITADAPRHGDSFDGHVDMLQMMFHRSILAEIEDPWFDEDPDTSVCRHSDGLFMNKVGLLLTEVPNIPDMLVTHRHTPLSTYN